MEEVLVRATWGTSFRPPTFRELYSPLVSNIGFVEEDPLRCPVTDDFFDCNGYEVNFSHSGNPDLDPDEGETWLFGVAWESSGAPGFSIALDYWVIEHSNRIITTDEEFVFYLLLAELPPEDNPFVTRLPSTPEDIALGIPGIIGSIQTSYLNADKVTTNGIDFNLDYVWTTSNAGSLSVGITYTRLLEYTAGVSFLNVQHVEDIAGGYAFNNGLPEDRGNLRLEWTGGHHAVAAVLNYAGDYRSPFNFVVDGEETETPFVVDDYWQLDLQYSYEFEILKGAMLRAGCRNCLDADPPVYNYIAVNEAFHEGRGALLYARWMQSF